MTAPAKHPGAQRTPVASRERASVDRHKRPHPPQLYAAQRSANGAEPAHANRRIQPRNCTSRVPRKRDCARSVGSPPVSPNSQLRCEQNEITFFPGLRLGKNTSRAVNVQQEPPAQGAGGSCCALNEAPVTIGAPPARQGTPNDSKWPSRPFRATFSLTETAF